MTSTEPVREDEKSLIERIQRGDVEAYGRFVEKHQDPLVGFLFRRVRNRALAEDLAQDAFLKAYQKIRTFEGRNDASLATWIFSIARNASLDVLRRGKWKMEAVEEDMPAFRQEASQASDLDGKRFRAVLDRALSGLDEEVRSAFELTLVEGFSYEEAADILSTRADRIRYHVHRTRERLRKVLGAFREEP